MSFAAVDVIIVRMENRGIFAGKRAVVFDMDGTLIDSVGIWNEVDRVLISAIRTDGGEAEPEGRSARDGKKNSACTAKVPIRTALIAPV